jgi:hypothetical protein
VSGACHGGQFASRGLRVLPRIPTCWRRCQLAEALAASDDYLRHFFRAATGNGSSTTGSRSRGHAAAATLYDAHWYASARLEDHQLSYTTTDALIDDYFAANPERLPAAMTVAEIQTAARALTRAEVDAVATLTAGLPLDLAIPLTGYVEANHAADATLADARELPSAERNALIALPYKLVLPLLARRIAYAGLKVNDAGFALAASCEQRSLQQFLGAPGGARSK